MKRILLGLIMGFIMGIVFSQYSEYEFNFDIDQYFKSEKSEGVLSIEHNFRYNNRSRKFDKILLQITKHNGPETQISTYTIPLVNHRYYLDVDVNELNKENDFTWVLYKGGVIHRISGNPLYPSPDSVVIFDQGNINDVRIVSQEPRLTGKKKATHSILIHNYNPYPVKPQLLITYYSANGNAIWNTVMTTNTEIPPEGRKNIELQVESKKLPLAETSNVTVVEVDHIRP